MSKFNKTKEWVIEEYVIKDRPRKEVAEECGLTLSGFKSLLNKLDIKKEKLNLSKEVIEEAVNRKLTCKQIEKELNISQTTVYRYLKKYGLTILADPIVVDRYNDINDNLICSLYLDGFSSTEIGKELGVSHKTILSHLKHCGIQVRTLTESQWNYNNKDFPEDLKSYDIVYNLYINQRLSKKDLSLKYNCSTDVIDRILKQFNIPIRGSSESKIGLVTGEKHWNWKGGITSLARRLREYFGTNQVIKVLERDNYKCQMCGSNKNLQVHHIKHFSHILKRILNENSNLDPINDINELYLIATKDKEFNDLSNLITYCRDCHLGKIHGYNLQADNKSCELLGNLKLESRDQMYDNQQLSLNNQESSTTISEESTLK